MNNNEESLFNSQEYNELLNLNNNIFKEILDESTVSNQLAIIEDNIDTLYKNSKNLKKELVKTNRYNEKIHDDIEIFKSQVTEMNTDLKNSDKSNQEIAIKTFEDIKAFETFVKEIFNEIKTDLKDNYTLLASIQNKNEKDFKLLGNQFSEAVCNLESMINNTNLSLKKKSNEIENKLDNVIQRINDNKYNILKEQNENLDLKYNSILSKADNISDKNKIYVKKWNLFTTCLCIVNLIFIVLLFIFQII